VPERGKAAAAPTARARLERTQPRQQLLGRLPGRRRRRLEPAEGRSVLHSRRRQREQRLAEIGARDLGQVVAPPHLEVVPRVEAIGAARVRASGAARALDRR
jgi:hypothetical protein